MLIEKSQNVGLTEWKVLDGVFLDALQRLVAPAFVKLLLASIQSEYLQVSGVGVVNGSLWRDGHYRMRISSRHT